MMMDISVLSNLGNIILPEIVAAALSTVERSSIDPYTCDVEVSIVVVWPRLPVAVRPTDETY
jgi:hypothetical protein